jgi:hypothetical protein
MNKSLIGKGLGLQQFLHPLNYGLYRLTIYFSNHFSFGSTDNLLLID